MLPFTPLFINGQSRPSSSNQTFEVRNPYSDHVVGTAASATSQDCKDAVESAAKAFVTWEHKSLPEKRDIFLKAADLLYTDKYKNQIFTAIVEETAAVPSWVPVNIVGAIRTLQYAASAVNDLKGDAYPSGIVPGAHTIVQRRAHGVILGMAPWNAPFALAIRALAIPIICGNTVVLKSSELTPRTQYIVAEVFREAGLPNGVLNLISMPRENTPTLTAELIANPAVRKINFTGSDRVGKILAAEAAKYLKPCVLELGGKAPAVVLNDANIDEASRAIVHGAMLHSGQICMSTERVIVQRGAAEALKSAIAALCEKLKAGDPTDSATQLSGLFSAASADNVLSLFQEAKDAGADVILGDLKKNGTVIQPHLFSGTKPGMRLWDRESFGPVIAFAEVDTVDEAVELANSTDYSLVASLWTRDVNSAFDVAGRIRAGCTNVNGTTFHSEPAAPLGGLGGASGYGRFDIANFTDKRTIVIHPSHREYPLVG